MGIHHHPGPIGPFFWPAIIARLVIVALFVLVPWIIALAYVWRDARRRGQPGWLWALAGIFLGWLGILAYLVVRALMPLGGLAYPTGAPGRPNAPVPPPAPMPPTNVPSANVSPADMPPADAPPTDATPTE